MHAAIGLMMGLFLFALVMIVMNLAAVGVPITGRRAQVTAAITGAIKIHTKATRFRSDEAAVLKA
jgi:hypothetical protein